jgi:hypothetical protein
MSSRVAWMAVLALLSPGCTAVVSGTKLSDRPDQGRGIYLSTGGAPGPYRTLGFAQVRGYGVEVAGALDVGEAALDGAIKGALADAAAKMGGHGVIHIEFIDENPSTPVERGQRVIQSVQDLSRGQGGVQQQDRYVTVTGEIIQFLDP